MASIENSFREIVEDAAERHGIFNRVIGIGDSSIFKCGNRFFFITEIELDST